MYLSDMIMNMKINYKRIYRAISVAARDMKPTQIQKALRVAREENWSITPVVYRKIDRKIGASLLYRP
jgi:hypothetical protein